MKKALVSITLCREGCCPQEWVKSCAISRSPDQQWLPVCVVIFTAARARCDLRQPSPSPLSESPPVVGVGSGGAVSHRGPRLDSVRAGGAEPGLDSGKDRGLPRGQRGLRRRPGCPWLPAPALRSHLGPGHESSLNTPLHYCCVPGRWMWASGA